MTILKAELIKVVNDSLNRKYDVDGTELDTQITAVLKDISKRGNFLTEESTRKTEAELAYYSMPDHYKDKLLIMIDDYYPLEWETFKQYQEEISVSSTTGYPKKYSKMNKFYYLRPTPDAEYTIRQFFASFHPEKVIVDSKEYDACDQILFNDIYREAIELRLIWKVAMGLEMYEAAREYMSYYVKDEIPSLLNNLDEDPVIAEYPDN